MPVLFREFSPMWSFGLESLPRVTVDLYSQRDCVDFNLQFGSPKKYVKNIHRLNLTSKAGHVFSRTHILQPLRPSLPGQRVRLGKGRKGVQLPAPP